MSHLALSVLGEFQVKLDGVPISSFESDKVRALLAYLAVEADHSHPRDTLVGLLWPDCPEQVARHNLRQALFNLRLALGDHTAKPPYLLITREAIQFNQESDYSLDLDQFNAYFSTWEKNWGQVSGETATFVGPLEEMVQSYHGEFLEHFYLGDSSEFEEWILVQREATHQRVMEALTTLATEYEQKGDFQTARQYARRQLELDPWREEAHSQIMRMLAQEGQRTAAMAQYENCRKVLAEELGVEPSQKTRDLYEQIRLDKIKPKDGPPTQVQAAPVHNLPLPLTPFIGREQELSEISQLVADPQYRCITLVGPGGIGKTRLALQAAEQHWNKFSHGSAFIPLASVGSLEAAIPAFANGIDFAFYGPADPKIQLLRYLQGKEMLLVVDNVEHLLAENCQNGTIAELLIEILQKAVAVKLLVTSREVLNMQGEWPFELQGLSFPRREGTDGCDDFSALSLFIQRARRARPGFEMNTNDKAEVTRICRLVEGMPLAIELAAAWARILSPTEIATEIEHNLDFLKAQMRDLPERHRSMRAVFDHSWQMLSPQEKQVFSKLSVFRGGFGRQAAERVAGASLQVLSSLVIRSLLRHSGTGRYDLHELVRQYAASKLAEEPGELHRVYEQHGQYYLGLLEEKETKLFSSDQQEAKSELTREMDNIRAAWDWSVANQDFMTLYRISFTMLYLFTMNDWFKEGMATFGKTVEAVRAAVQVAGPDDRRLQIALHAMLAHYGYFLFRQGRNEEAYGILRTSAAFFRTTSEPTAICYSHWDLGIACWILGKFSEAKESFQVCLEFARKYGERFQEILAVEFLGRIAQEEGAYEQARPYFHEALANIRRLGDPSMTAHVLSYYGRLMQSLGKNYEAEKMFREGLELAREINYRFAIGLALDGLGQVAHAQGSFEVAETFFSESASLFREAGDHRLSRTLNHQGLNFLALGDTTRARNAFHEALRKSHQGGQVTIALHSLAGLAALEVRQTAGRGTLEIVLYILKNPSSAQETRDLAERLQVELESRLSKEEIEAAQQGVWSKSLEEIIPQILTKS